MFQINYTIKNSDVIHSYVLNASTEEKARELFKEKVKENVTILEIERI